MMIYMYIPFHDNVFVRGNIDENLRKFLLISLSELLSEPPDCPDGPDDPDEPSSRTMVHRTIRMIRMTESDDLLARGSAV